MTGPLDLHKPIPDATWMGKALCASSYSGDLHFPDAEDYDMVVDDDGGPLKPMGVRALVRRQTQAAISMCLQGNGGKPCEALAECGQLADKLKVKDGVWGGKDYSPAGRMGHHAYRTHCPKGHEYTPENTRVAKSGRKCRACDALTSASRKRATGRTAA